MFWKFLSHQLFFFIALLKNLTWLVKYLVLISVIEHNLLYVAPWVWTHKDILVNLSCIYSSQIGLLVKKIFFLSPQCHLKFTLLFPHAGNPCLSFWVLSFLSIVTLKKSNCCFLLPTLTWFIFHVLKNICFWVLLSMKVYKYLKMSCPYSWMII